MAPGRLFDSAMYMYVRYRVGISFRPPTTLTQLLRSACRFSTAPVRRAALGADGGNADANSKGQSDETRTPATPPSAGKGGASSAEGDGASTSTTPLGKRAEEGGQGGDTGEGDPEAPSPTKARKGSR